MCAVVKADVYCNMDFIKKCEMSSYSCQKMSSIPYFIKAANVFYDAHLSENS